MKIGIDISQITYQGTGVGRFTNSLVNALLENKNKNQYTFFFSSLRRNLDSDLENKIKSNGHKLIKWKIPPTLLSFLWNNCHSYSSLPTNYSLQPTNFDYFISSDWTEPPINTNKATIVHDLVYLKYPETLPKIIIETQKKRMSLVKKESKIIFTDSQATKQDLVNLLNIKAEKIVVNYPGVDVHFPAKENIKKTLEKYKITKPFILSVGKQEPRKNIKRLIQAFQQINNQNIQLIIVGVKGWGNLPAGGPISNIKYLGYVSDSDLYSLYSSCHFFIYPSLYEGFGYPIIEAMKLGAPVACSNTSSMGEIAKDAALLFDPLKTEEIFRCIDTLIKNENLRKDLIIKGKERAKLFNWEKYYNILIKKLELFHN